MKIDITQIFKGLSKEGRAMVAIVGLFLIAFVAVRLIDRGFEMKQNGGNEPSLEFRTNPAQNLSDNGGAKTNSVPAAPPVTGGGA